MRGEQRTCGQLAPNHPPHPPTHPAAGASAPPNHHLLPSASAPPAVAAPPSCPASAHPEFSKLGVARQQLGRQRAGDVVEGQVEGGELGEPPTTQALGRPPAAPKLTSCRVSSRGKTPVAAHPTGRPCAPPPARCLLPLATCLDSACRGEMKPRAQGDHSAAVSPGGRLQMSRKVSVRRPCAQPGGRPPRTSSCSDSSCSQQRWGSGALRGRVLR